MKEIKADDNSITGKYLTWRYQIKLPKERRSPRGWLTVYGAEEHNLKNFINYLEKLVRQLTDQALEEVRQAQQEKENPGQIQA